MNRHPGGEEQTIHLLKSIELKKGMKALDLGAGEGETVRIMKAFGLNVQGVDLAPRSSEVQQGDFLTLQYAADSMDLCISQCAFFVWREYYLEAIWNDSFCCEDHKLLQKEYKGRKIGYTMVVGRKE